MNTVDGLPRSRNHSNGAIVQRNVGAGMDDRIEQISSGAFCSDVRQVWSDDSARAIQSMALGAAVFPVHDSSSDRIACRGVQTAVPAKLLYIGHHPPHFHVGETEGARHLRIRNAVADHLKELAVRGSM